MVGWHHQLNGHGFGWTPGVGDGQGGLACCGSWGCKELHVTKWLNWTELPFLSFIVHILALNSPFIALIFLKRSLVFPILLFSSVSLHCSLKAFLSLFAILWNAAFRWIYITFSPLPFTSLLCSAVCKASSISHFAALYFFLFGVVLVLPPVQCYEPPSIVLCILPDLIPWIYSSPPLYDYKGFDLGHTWMP